jgi:FKBP-type peptidyl-prolyl cis-trans isomerase
LIPQENGEKFPPNRFKGIFPGIDFRGKVHRDLSRDFFTSILGTRAMPCAAIKTLSLALFASVTVLSMTACGQSMDRASEDPALLEANLKAGEAFLDKTAREPGVVKMPSGILYKVVASPNPAAVKPTLQDTVKVHYEGTLVDGTVFDSSYQRGVPAAFPLQGLVKAWQIAIPEMHKGDTWMLYVPPELGYGAEAAGDIPANSVLVFKIQLLDIQGK